MTFGRSHATPAGIYIHVPFCRAKCPYCDFYSVARPEGIADYLTALASELERSPHQGIAVDTVYFGGGTPSLLTPDQIGSILSRVRAGFAVAAGAEITLEVNPGTVDAAALRGYRAAGINRLNIGLQSVDDRHLNFLGRIHTADQGIGTLGWARDAGFDNVGLDLIYALPGQGMDEWQRELAVVVKLGAEHLSCYTLTLEPGTPMAAREARGDFAALDEQTAAALFSFTIDFLNRSGYRQYEISNFARVDGAAAIDRRSRHNRKYWTSAPYLGFGPSAHSFLDNRRWWNHRSLARYLDELRQGRSPQAGEERLSREQRIVECVYLGLRQTDGIDRQDFHARFGADCLSLFGAAAEPLIGEGMLAASTSHIRLTPRGMLLLESVAGRLLNSE